MLFFSDIPWSALYQRPQHLATRFAAHEELLWVEPAVIGRLPGRISVDGAEGRIAGLVLPYLPFNAKNSIVRSCARTIGRFRPAHSLLEGIQERMLRNQILPGREAVGSVAYLQNFQALHAVKALRPALLVYDCIDHPFGFTTLPPHLHRLWQETVDSADVLVASSPSLGAFLRQMSGRDAHVVSNGVEFDRFSTPVSRPADLPDDGVPIAGYVGSVYPWIDFDLLEGLCQALPAVRFVIVGREHPEVRPRLAALSRLANFRFLGVRPYTAVPSYLQHFSVGLIPFLRTRLTEGVNPVKLYEYAAAGVPVVVTPFSDDLSGFGPILERAQGVESSVAAVREAIALRSSPAHCAMLASFARANDWQGKAEEILRLIVPPISSTSSTGHT